MAEQREVILDAACEVVATEGIRGLSIERVAKEAGLTVDEVKKDIQDHVSLTREAFDHAIHRTMMRFSDRFGGRPTLERLEHLLIDYVDDVDDVGDVVRQEWIFWIEMEAASLFDDSYDDILKERSADWRRTLVTLIDVCRENGSVPAEVDAEAAGTRLLLVQDSLGREVALATYPRELAREEMLFAFRRELHVG